ncbi:MAG: hypothetical protein OXI80_13840 [Caldilineaceae bacterium]|nr:hypothetical protein [Caldilineaceae bacterium]MDE0338746.1 hypothetical protein [Caldilineaceae bacterium]
MSDLTVVSVDEKEYQALASGAALQLRPQFGVLLLGERDRADFLQRMTTNDIARLQPGEAALTILTSPVARIDAVFCVLGRQDDLMLLSSDGQADSLRQHLQSQIFFMDKVTVTDESANLGRLRLLGPAAGELLQAAGLPQPAADDHFLEEESVIVLRQERYDIPGYEIINSVDNMDALQERLTDAGAVLLEGADSFEARCIELGRPRPGKELTDAFSPLETGMAWVCAEDKGCYTGQEIIARQLTYDKVTRTLVRLRSELPLPEGAAARFDGRAVGTVTSSAVSPSTGPVALAVLKRPHNAEGVEVTVEGIAAYVEQISLPSI